MQAKIISFIFLFLFLKFPVGLSQDKIGVITKIRGSTSQLLGGEREARAISINDKVFAESSILTGARSNIVLQFDDQSILSLGGHSKVSIDFFSTNETSLITLYKGKIRLKVSNRNFYIKNRLGIILLIKGDYLIYFNPDSSIMSLTTFEGEAKVFKIDEEIKNNLSSEYISEISRNETTNRPYIIKKSLRGINLSHVLERMTTTAKGVSTKPAETTILGPKITTPSHPFFISSLQLKKLKENIFFDEKKTSELSGVDKPLLAGDRTEISKSKSDSGWENFSQFVSGGFLDLQTGFYIEPLEGSAGANDNLIGSIDEKTGQYISPEGLSLTESGFELISRENSPAKRILLLNELNTSLENNFINRGTALKDTPLYNKYLSDKLSFSFGLASERIYLNKDNSSANRLELNSQSFYILNFDWQMSSLDRVVPIVGFNLSQINYKDLEASNVSSDSKTLFGLKLGAILPLSNKFDFYSIYQLQQRQFLNQTSFSGTVNYNMVKLAVSQLNFGFKYIHRISNKLLIDSKAGVMFNFTKKINDIKLHSSFGFQIDSMIKYDIGRKRFLALGLGYQDIEQNLSNTSVENKLRRLSSSYLLEFIQEF